MTRSFLLALLAVPVLLGADNPWTKVQDLKHGVEVRIYRKGVSEPLIVKLDEVNEDRILVVSMNAQMAVAKADIERLDARPLAKTVPRKVTTESTAKTVDPDYTPVPPGGVKVPTTSYGSTATWGGGSKPDFETVYRRVAEPPRK